MADYEITLTIDDSAEATLAVDDDVGVLLSLDDAFVDGGRRYDGPYEVTPTRYTQILPTSGKKMNDDVTINPIPHEYGLITWDGSSLMVS